MWLTCPECRDETAFEQPPCGEGHGRDCPEWFCVMCGFSVFIGGYSGGSIGEADDAHLGELDDELFGITAPAEPTASRRARRPHAA